VILPIYSWQMLLLSEATLSVGLMAVALVVFRRILQDDAWGDWLLGGLVVAVATTLDWWNGLWAAGFLLFYLLDPRRSGRFLAAKTFVFAGIALTGLLPFLAYHWLTAGYLGLRYWPMLHAHQYWDPACNLLAFGKEQIIWCGPLGVLALGAVVGIRRTGIPFLREHLCTICVPIPGLLVQAGLAIMGRADQDVMAALGLPWLLVAAVIGTRMAEQHVRWKNVIWVLAAASILQTLSGFWPASAAWWGSRFAPQPYRRLDNVAAEVARSQTETGASFLVAETPRDASLLSFYLPLHAFVYVVPHEGIQTQYDLWANYYDFKGANAIFLSRHLTEAPAEIQREFSEVKTLRDINMVGQPPWRLFSCDHYGAAP
jgi:hypothetical protein